jgi:hypothetical protein
MMLDRCSIDYGGALITRASFCGVGMAILKGFDVGGLIFLSWSISYRVDEIRASFGFMAFALLRTIAFEQSVGDNVSSLTCTTMPGSNLDSSWFCFMSLQ